MSLPTEAELRQAINQLKSYDSIYNSLGDVPSIALLAGVLLAAGSINNTPTDGTNIPPTTERHKKSFFIGDGENLVFTIVHNLDTINVDVEGIYKEMIVDSIDFRPLDSNTIEVRASRGSEPIEPNSLHILVSN